MNTRTELISIIVPMYNEADNVQPFYQAIAGAIKDIPYRFELLLIDDGSSDGTFKKIRSLAKKYSIVRPVELARNFGKEIALTAGLREAKGEAAIMIDADLQHPPELIQEFIKKWEGGADMVIGVRKEYKTSIIKKGMSNLFYKIINKVSDTELVPHATDFRLVDRNVIDAFNKFTERNRITRGLFDWLGFRRSYIHFSARERLHGQASYTYKKLFKLGINSFVGHTLFPLRVAGIIGWTIVILSMPLGIFIFMDRYILADSFGFTFSGSAILAVINLFLSGIMLTCLGFISTYLAHVHEEVTNRPLYVKRAERRKPKKLNDGSK